MDAMFTWKPIRKVVVGGLTYFAVLGARKYLHLDLGADGVADAINGGLGLVASYAVKDARVKAVADELERSALAGEVETLVLGELAKHGVKALGPVTATVQLDGRAVANAVAKVAPRDGYSPTAPQAS